jgi:hypothetical protein
MASDSQAPLARRWTKSRYRSNIDRSDTLQTRASSVDRRPRATFTRAAARVALAREVGTSTRSGGAGGDHATMTIVRREHRAQFTIVLNAIFLDDRLSIEAKGVLGYMLSRPHSWQVRLDHVGRPLRIGRKKLQRIFRELIDAGYVTREQPRTADAHHFREIDYVVRDVPLAPFQPVDTSPGPRGGKGPAEPKAPRI